MVAGLTVDVGGLRWRHLDVIGSTACLTVRIQALTPICSVRRTAMALISWSRLVLVRTQCREYLRLVAHPRTSDKC